MQKMILLIDDDKEELFILDQAFQLAGLPYSCVWASGLDRANQLLKEILPDYILIDYNMPKTNGIDCLEKVRNMPGIDKVPIGMYSNHISEETRRQAMAKGASFCIQKPGSIAALIKSLTKFMGGVNLLPGFK